MVSLYMKIKKNRWKYKNNNKKKKKYNIIEYVNAFVNKKKDEILFSVIL